MPPLRVLHVQRPIHGGVPRVVATLARDQVARGWSVDVACPDASEMVGLAEAAGARRLRWEAERSPGPATASEVRALAELIDATRPDLVHLHASKAGLAGRLAMRGRLPTVLQPHCWSFEIVGGATGFAARAWEVVGARWADVVVCVSEGEHARGRAGGVRSRWTVVPNGVDLARFSVADGAARREARAALGAAAGAPLAVVIGRCSWEKGQDLALDAWPAVRARVPAAELAIVGDGDTRPELEAREVEGVRFTGWSDDIGRWLAAADVVVVPSRFEAGSLVVLEAMATGRPVVGADVDGMADALRGEAGAIVPVEAVGRLAEAIADRLSDPARSEREGAAGRAIVERDYSLDVTNERIARVYGAVLERRS